MEYATLTLATGRRIRLSVSDISRFWNLVAEPDANGCCIWLGRSDREGYGVFRVSVRGKRALLSAHRVAFRLLNNRSARRTMDVDHECYNRLCMAHLRELSAKINRGGQRRRGDVKTFCVNGHPREGNSYVHPKTGYRTCTLCRAAAAERWRARASASTN